MGNKRKNKQGDPGVVEVNIRINRKCIKRWLIIILLCGNLVPDSTLLSQKAPLGQIGKNNHICTD